MITQLETFIWAGLWEVDMIDRALLRESFHARIPKLLTCSIFSLAIAALLPACTLLEFKPAPASAENVAMNKIPIDQLDKKEARSESASYDGNWGYAPGNGLDPNDEWGRSRGVLDTTSPGCPFKFC